MLKVGLIGVSGFGTHHRHMLERLEQEGIATLSAAVIIDAVKEKDADIERELRKKGVTVYRTHEEMLSNERGRLDMVNIPCGIAAHAPLSVAALRAGYDVYCEKPAAGNIDAVTKMRGTARDTGRSLIIGYQLLTSPLNRRIKEITTSQKYGKLRSATTACCWPRSSNYYQRNEWAGNQVINGEKIFDSPAHNATSHFLQNMIYISGPAKNTSARPIEIYGENYSAKSIESADTQFLRIKSENGVLIQFYTTHACRLPRQARSIYEYEHGRVICWPDGAYCLRHDIDRYTLEETISEDTDLSYIAFNEAYRHIRNGQPIPGVIENCWQEVVCIEESFRSSNGVTSVAPAHIETDTIDDQLHTFIPGIEEDFDRLLLSGLSFQEAGLTWAPVAGCPITSSLN